MGEIYVPWFASQFVLSASLGLSLRNAGRAGILRKSAPLLLALPIPALGAFYIAYLHWIAFANEPQFGPSDFVTLACVIFVLWLLGVAVCRVALFRVPVQGANP
jgi:hypothetical protein